jgi:hypothetical protein
MDWNWFFSSLAQSVAALVGVFSAFVITKIVNNQSEFSKKVARTQELLDISLKHKDAASLCYFAWVNEHRMKDAMENLTELLNKGEPIQTAEQYYSRVAFPQYVPRAEVIKQIQQLLPKESAAPSADDEEWPDEYSSKAHDESQIPAFRMPIIRLDPEIRRLQIERDRRLEDNVERESERIENLRLEVRHHMRLVNQQITAIQGNPESSDLINFSIGAALLLFVVGVIYPLSFLPYTVDSQITFGAFFTILLSLKGFMLAIVALVFVALMVRFWRVNSSLKHDPVQVQKLRDAGEFGFYSEYFQIRANNANEYNEWLQKTNAEESKDVPAPS